MAVQGKKAEKKTRLWWFSPVSSQKTPSQHAPRSHRPRFSSAGPCRATIASLPREASFSAPGRRARLTRNTTKRSARSGFPPALCFQPWKDKKTKRQKNTPTNEFPPATTPPHAAQELSGVYHEWSSGDPGGCWSRGLRGLRRQQRQPRGEAKDKAQPGGGESRRTWAGCRRSCGRGDEGPGGADGAAGGAAGGVFSERDTQICEWMNRRGGKNPPVVDGASQCVCPGEGCHMGEFGGLNT